MSGKEDDCLGIGEANHKAILAKQRAKEACTEAEIFLRHAKAAEARSRDLAGEASAASNLVAHLEDELARKWGEPGIPHPRYPDLPSSKEGQADDCVAEPFPWPSKTAKEVLQDNAGTKLGAWVDEKMQPGGITPPAEAALAHDRKWGPWLTFIESDGVWETPKIVQRWEDVQRRANGLVPVTAKSCALIMMPMRWVKWAEDMLNELCECRKVMREESLNALCNGGISLRLRDRAASVEEVIAQASPPADGAEG